MTGRRDWSAHRHRSPRSYSSTSDFSRAKALSHCLETCSRYLRTSSIGFVSSANWLSRPTRTQRTTPALSRTRRCLVTACRVRLVPAVRREIDCGSPFVSLTSTDRRVSSPKAANMDAWVFDAAGRLCRLSDMLCDVFKLDAPTALVHPKCLLAASAW